MWIHKQKFNRKDTRYPVLNDHISRIVAWNEEGFETITKTFGHVCTNCTSKNGYNMQVQY